MLVMIYVRMQIYQDANASVEGGQYEIIDENEGSMVGSTGPAQSVQVKLGKLGKHNIICSYNVMITSLQYTHNHNNNHYYTHSTEVICGYPKSRQHVVLPLPSEAAIALFHSVNCCLPPDARTFAKTLLDVFFSEEELARSCCTKAVGRELLDQTVLRGIKCKLSVMIIVIPKFM